MKSSMILVVLGGLLMPALSGCAVAPNDAGVCKSPLTCNHAGCKNRLRWAVDPRCHGFNPTCWQDWPPCCPPCPPPVGDVNTMPAMGMPFGEMEALPPPVPTPPAQPEAQPDTLPPAWPGEPMTAPPALDPGVPPENSLPPLPSDPGALPTPPPSSALPMPIEPGANPTTTQAPLPMASPFPLLPSEQNVQAPSAPMPLESPPFSYR